MANGKNLDGLTNKAICFTGVPDMRQRQGKQAPTAGSDCSRISSDSIQLIIDKLLNKQIRNTTNKAYLGIWRQFNKFLIRLDKKPDRWEDRVTLFVGHKINEGTQSSTIKTYVSAIKKTLV